MPDADPPGPSDDSAGPPATTLTGERTVSGVAHENYWFRRHEAGYLAAASRVPHGALVLDAGCGEGDGLRALTGAGGRVLGLDYDGPCLARAARAVGGWARDGGAPAAVARANLVALPLADAVADVLVSLQVVEHLWSTHEFLVECARVLRPGGRLVVTTPNRLTFSPGRARDAKPANHFHVRELDADQLVAEVGRHLRVEEVLAVHHGPRLTGTDVVHRQLAAAPEHWDASLAALVAGVRADDFVVSDRQVDQGLDLLVVARR